MLENLLTILHGAVLLAFGISLTAAFAGIRFIKRNLLIFFGLFAFSGILQLTATLFFSEAVVWKLYPLIAHLPLILLLRFQFRKSLATAATSAFTAYLCCQPSKWIGVIVYELGKNTAAELAVRIVSLVLFGYVAIIYVSTYLSKIFSKDSRSVCIFGLAPIVYYIFDYVVVVYSDLWLSNNRAVAEFMPVFLAATYVSFCFLYYREYEQKSDAQHKEQIIRISVEQQAKEIAAVRQTEQEIRLLRHDMRLLLSSLAVSLENGDTATARKMIDTHIARIDGTKLEHFCSNDIINCVISDYASRCKEQSVKFSCVIELKKLDIDEILLSSILSNALDNALNAQALLPTERRSIKLMLKNSGDKLLISVKNPVDNPVIFSDGLPVSCKEGHGYGTQSIRYLTERMGGNCQFSVQDGHFILRVVF